MFALRLLSVEKLEANRLRHSQGIAPGSTNSLQVRQICKTDGPHNQHPPPPPPPSLPANAPANELSFTGYRQPNSAACFYRLIQLQPGL